MRRLGVWRCGWPVWSLLRPGTGALRKIGVCLDEARLALIAGVFALIGDNRARISGLGIRERGRLERGASAPRVPVGLGNVRFRSQRWQFRARLGPRGADAPRSGRDGWQVHGFLAEYGIGA